MKNLQNLHLNIICGDNMVNVMVSIIIFIILFFAALTLGVVLVYLYIKVLAKLFDWLDKKLGK